MFVTCAFVCALLFAGKITATDSPPSLDIQVSDQQVTLKAENVELRQILEELTDKADITLWISDKLQARNITASFEKEPLRAVLNRLLQDTSYVLVQGEDSNSVAALYVLPSGDEQTVMVDLKPDIVIDTTQAMQNFVPNILVDIEQVMQDALQSDTVPEEIKAALLNQRNANQEALAQQLEVQRLEVMTRLIDTFEANGLVDAETLQGLRETLEQTPGQTAEQTPELK